MAVKEHPNAPFPEPKKKNMKGMEATLMLMLDLVRNRLAVYNNYRLKNNNYEHIRYTRAIEAVISAITELKRFH